MADDGGMAFARLFSQRRGELDLSVVDIAAKTGRPIEVVVGWEQGMSVPDAADLPEVAGVLRLPLPLLEEASRRVAVSLENTPPPLPHSEMLSAGETDAGPSGISIGESPAAGRPVEVFHPEARPSVLSYLNDLLTRVRESMTRRRLRARAPAARPSYLEDRDQMVTYRLRMVLTATGVAILALVLRWSLGGLGSAVADLWEALTAAL